MYVCVARAWAPAPRDQKRWPDSLASPLTLKNEKLFLNRPFFPLFPRPLLRRVERNLRRTHSTPHTTHGLSPRLPRPHPAGRRQESAGALARRR